ncbi:MAG: histidinol-phosphate transaminase [Verrucomicrobiota bacterium]|nr:histidinol-phosphate transaminase [Verrucomicrobiota bacterium]
MSLVRKHVQRMHAYMPGEQPKERELIKLNTNENPYPPAPKVLSAIKRAVDDRLRLYPDPRAGTLREQLAALHGVNPENVIIGNGSDELLGLATRAFVDPGGGCVQYFTPSYSLYPVLADIHNAKRNEVCLLDDFSLPAVAQLRKEKDWNFRAALTYITTPNAPTGCGYTTAELDALCLAQKGVVVLDEAYVDFAEESAMDLALKHSHVLVSRTFSKAYSLCFQRIGYFVGSRELISALDKIRDSYNVNGLGQVAAGATLKSLPYYRSNFRKIIKLRARVGLVLAGLGFETLPSQANFILTKPPRFAASTWLKKLRAQKILVRHFKESHVKDYLRITIGSEKDMNVLLRAIRTILKS